MATANDYVMYAINSFACENACGTLIKPGDPIQMMSMTDIRLVCMQCFIDNYPYGRVK